MGCRGTSIIGTRRTSLIVDPPDGRIPQLTPEGQHRADARREYLREHQADSWRDAASVECSGTVTMGCQTRLEEVAAWPGDLPTLSPVATRVLELTKRNSTGTSALEQEILHDQALATRILRLANSAAYAGSGTVATVSRLIATDCTYPDSEEAFITGLVHDVGKVVMDANLRDRYEKIIVSVYNLEADSFVEAERMMFGFDHAEVGFLVARAWGLPPAIAESVRYHHDPASAVVDPQLCAIVSLANGLSVKLELGPHQRPVLELAALPATEQLGLSTDGLDRLLARAAARAAAELEPYSPVWSSRYDGQAA